jgi:hypothetical protein
LFGKYSAVIVAEKFSSKTKENYGTDTGYAGTMDFQNHDQLFNFLQEMPVLKS